MFRNARRIAALAVVVAALPAASASAAGSFSGGVSVAAGDVTGATIPTQTAFMKIVLEDVIVSSATAGSPGREQNALGIAVAVEPEAIGLLLPAVQKIREAATR